jgi:subfamily B ATP-binding cassette protein MsbA
VFDDVLKARRPVHGWLNRLVIMTAGEDPVAILKFAVLLLPHCPVGRTLLLWRENLTTSVGQWVMHDLRRTL